MLKCPLESFYVANSEQPVCYANPPAVVLDIFSRQYVQNYNETIRNSAIGLICYILSFREFTLVTTFTVIRIDWVKVQPKSLSKLFAAINFFGLLCFFNSVNTMID